MKEQILADLKQIQADITDIKRRLDDLPAERRQRRLLAIKVACMKFVSYFSNLL